MSGNAPRKSRGCERLNRERTAKPVPQQKWEVARCQAACRANTDGSRRFSGAAGLEAARWSRIINISSSSALTGTAELTHYSASKGGMIVLTRSLALELGPLGITVNNIAPGTIVNTVMADAGMEQFSISREDMSQRIPVRRTGEPDDIAYKPDRWIR
jgi:NAD(P)-dependent dehydrogenase (short-subunit alcohol dehydrogenase family)